MTLHAIPKIEPAARELVDGVFEIQGVLRYDGATIQIEYRSVNAVQQPRSAVKKLVVMLEDLASPGAFGYRSTSVAMTGVPSNRR